MVSRARQKKSGLVSLDILWILILLALVVVLGLKGIGLVEKREFADRVQKELKDITAAVEQLAVETDLPVGEKVEFGRYGEFIRKGASKRLREQGKDPLGNFYGEQVVGESAVADEATVAELKNFW